MFRGIDIYYIQVGTSPMYEIQKKKEGAEMAYKDAKDAYKYNNDFNREKYDRISLMVKSGKKDIIKEKAAANNESVNAFINRAIDMLLENS